MGKKGDKLTSAAEAAAAAFTSRVAKLGDVSSKKMLVASGSSKAVGEAKK